MRMKEREAHLEVQIDNLVECGLDFALEDSAADLHPRLDALNIKARRFRRAVGRRGDRIETGFACKVFGGREVPFGEEVVGDEKVQITARVKSSKLSAPRPSEPGMY